MDRMLSAVTVANYFLHKGQKDGISMSPMKLLKLVYIAHGWNLGIHGEPLIRERIKAWDYGPVVPKVYHAVKQFGRRPITEPIPAVKETILPTTRLLLDRVWDVYRGFSGAELSTMTHADGTPWDEIKKAGDDEIPNDLIKRHYEARIKNQPPGTPQ